MSGTRDRRLSARAGALVAVGLSLAGAGMMAGCAKLAVTPAAPDAGTQLGNDLLGQPCRAVTGSNAGFDAGLRAPLDLYCGTAKTANGQIMAMRLGDEALPPSVTGEARRAAILAAAKISPFGQLMAQRMECRPGEWLALDGQTPAEGATEIYAAACNLKSGNWSYGALTTVIGRQLVQVSGAPAVLPIAARALPLATGATAPGPGLAEAAMPRLQAQFGGDIAGAAGDVDSFRDLTELARLYDSVGNAAGSERAYRQALEIQERSLPPTSPGIGQTLMQLALQVSAQGRPDEATLLMNRADPLVRGDAGALTLPRLTSYRAQIAANDRRYEEALKLASEATEQRRDVARRETGAASAAELTGRTGAPKVLFGSAANYHAEIAHSLYIEAAMLLRLGKLGQADAAITESLEILGSVPAVPLWWRPRFLAVAAEIAIKLNDRPRGEALITRGLAISRQLYGEGPQTATLAMLAGRLQAEEGALGPAVTSFRGAVEALSNDEIGRSRLTLDQLMPYLAALSDLSKARPTERAALGAEMFRVSQLIPAGVANQTIQRASARLAVDDPAISTLIRELQEAERARDTTQIELATEATKAADRRTPGREAELATALRGQIAAVSALEKKVLAAFPAYATLTKPRALTVEEVEQRLSPDEAVISFVIGADRSFAFVVRDSGITGAPIGIDLEDLNDSVGKLRKAFTSKTSQLPAYDLQGAHLLYKKLFGQVESALDGVKHLVVIPTGALLSLPPALFVTKPPANELYTEAQWLDRTMATSIAPSIRAFIDLRGIRDRAHAASPFVAFANPPFEGPPKGAAASGDGLEAMGQECRQGAGMPPEFLRGLAPLPETADEVKRVGVLLGAEPDAYFIGAQATEENARAHLTERYRVIYFATHGLLPGELKCQSEPGLALAPPAKQTDTPDGDGLLSATEIAKLRLNADLVVLSACNTAGGGGKFGGEALSGLAEAFFYAGARSMLVTHWTVPSVATVSLTTGLFQRLAKTPTLGTAEALRESQLDLINDPKTSHPFFWAAFTLVGDGGGGTPPKPPARAAAPAAAADVKAPAI